MDISQRVLLGISAGAQLGGPVGAVVGGISGVTGSVFWSRLVMTDYSVIETPHFKVSEEVVREITETKYKVKQYVKPKNIAKDAIKMKEMVLAAKSNDFNKVERMLMKKKHLINGIPAERAWSALHQAAYLNNVKAVQMLLGFENCDHKIRAKRDCAGLTKPGDEPIMLTESQEIKDILDNKTSISKSDLPTFVIETLGNIYMKEGIPLFLMSPAFLAENLAVNYIDYDDFYGLTQNFFGLIQENLTTVKASLAESLYVFSPDLYKKMNNIKRFDDFIREIIQIYTSGSISICNRVNLALRRSSENLNPTGDDLLLCLYSFILETFLLNGSFPAYSGTTYRGSELNSDQLSVYKLGTTFYWMSFTSSSKEKDCSFPANVKFIIDNDCNSKWKPRDIISYSQIPDEAEMLYPAGAKFRVTSVDESSDPIEINLKLIQ